MMSFLKMLFRLSCSQCILQWTYTAGNNWGVCANGTGELGCGPQETFRLLFAKFLFSFDSLFLFRACSDIRILPSGKRKPSPSKVAIIDVTMYSLISSENSLPSDCLVLRRHNLWPEPVWRLLRRAVRRPEQQHQCHRRIQQGGGGLWTC